MNFNDTGLSSFNIVSGFGDSPRYNFFLYAKGYEECAKVLTDNFHNKDSYGDYNGYPIVFLYRHALELYLKGIIYNGAKLSSYSHLEPLDEVLSNPKNNKTHNLDILSEKSIKLLLVMFPDDQSLKDLCENVRKISLEYMKLDKDSYSYRYPINNSGQWSTQENQTANITSIAQNMESLFNQFEILSYGLNIETDKMQIILDELISE